MKKNQVRALEKSAVMGEKNLQAALAKKGGENKS